jgi:hypothetical protein
MTGFYFQEERYRAQMDIHGFRLSDHVPLKPGDCQDTTSLTHSPFKIPVRSCHYSASPRF